MSDLTRQLTIHAKSKKLEYPTKLFKKKCSILLLQCKNNFPSSSYITCFDKLMINIECLKFSSIFIMLTMSNQLIILIILEEAELLNKGFRILKK